MTPAPVPGPESKPRATLRQDRVNLLSVSVALIIAAALLTAYQYWALRDSLHSDLEVQAHMVADHAQAALLFEDKRAAEEILVSLRASETVAKAVIIDQHGREFAAFERTGEARSTTRLRGMPDDAQKMEVSHTIAVGGTKVGTVVITGRLAQAHARLAVFVLATLATCLLALLLARFLIRRMHRTVKQAEARLDFLAHFDPVTNLRNRHAFNERLDFSIERASRFGERVALLLLDLDNFKWVNDTLGHQAGDALLMNVAKRLTDRLRHSDTVCRLGGDEFAVILETLTDPHQAAAVAQNLVENIARPFEFDGKQFFVTASCGIGLFPDHAENVKDLIRNTDTAMYHAKDAGKNIVAVFRPEMNEKADRRINIEGALRSAIEEGTLELYYQPKVDFAGRRLAGVEALLRWKHPVQGFISPTEFIPVAEDSGLIIPLGAWLLRTACQQAAAWDAQGHAPVEMSVNISAIQLRDPKLVDVVAEALALSGLAPHRLELELTESMLMEDVELAIGVLHKLRDLGVALAIDDFGTGYSSMNYLKRFPISSLKIDKSFVADLPGDKEGVAITGAIIAMARALNLKTIAEGVETREQAHFLASAGCDYLQGYLFSPAVPASQLWEWCRASEFGEEAEEPAGLAVDAGTGRRRIFLV